MARPVRRAWLRNVASRPLALVLGTLVALALGVWILNAWIAVVGAGAWVVAAMVLWVLLVLVTSGVLWQRGR